MIFRHKTSGGVISASESEAEHLRMAGFIPMDEYESPVMEPEPQEDESPATEPEPPRKRGRPKIKRG